MRIDGLVVSSRRSDAEMRDVLRSIRSDVKMAVALIGRSEGANSQRYHAALSRLGQLDRVIAELSLPESCAACGLPRHVHWGADARRKLEGVCTGFRPSAPEPAAATEGSKAP